MTTSTHAKRTTTLTRTSGEQAALWRAIVGHDRQAALWADRQVKRFACGFLRSWENITSMSAEDLANDAWERLLERQAEFRGDCAVSTWLYFLVRSAFFDHVRKNKSVHWKCRGCGRALYSLPRRVIGTHPCLQSQDDVDRLLEVDATFHPEMPDLADMTESPASVAEGHELSEAVRTKLDALPERDGLIARCIAADISVTKHWRELGFPSEQAAKRARSRMTKYSALFSKERGLINARAA